MVTTAEIMLKMIPECSLTLKKIQNIRHCFAPELLVTSG
jgi:hypothetical protein